MIARIAILALLSCPALIPAAPGADVLEFVSSLAGDLANDDFASFIRHFDASMPGYAEFKSDAESLLGSKDVESEIEVIAESGDQQNHTLGLDWVLITRDKDALNGGTITRRFVVKCSLKRDRKTWKVVAFDPIRLFKP
jgi:hypothetical protein